MVTPTKSKKPYSLAASFERAIVTLAASRPRFYGRVAHALDIELMGDETAKLAMRAVHAIAKEMGHGPSSATIVVQRLSRWMHDGKYTFDQVKAVVDMCDEAEDAGLPSEDDACSELAPIIQRRWRDEATRAAIDAYGKGEDLSVAVELEQKAARLGQVDTSIGTIMGLDSFAEIRKLRDLERLRTGVVELDIMLDGGLQRCGLGVAVGASGDGKSMFLSHTTAVSVATGLHVAYASLELPKSLILARVKANLTGIPINSILYEVSSENEAMNKLASMHDRIGRLVVQDFTPHVTTVDDIRAWITSVEDEAERPVDLLVIDYGDKMTVKSKDKESGEYTMGRLVFEGLRVYAVEKKLFCWTASQANRQKDRKKRLDLNDVADSMHKIRVADLVITLNLSPEGEDMTFYIAKHRTGKSRMSVGPLPVDFVTGRVAPVVYEDL